MTAESSPETSNPETTPETAWPSVELAYGFVLPSYQMLIGRFEAADTRLTALLTLASVLMLAAPALGKAVDPSIQVDGRFLVGLVFFSVAISVGVYGRITGKLVLPDPGVLYRESLHEGPWEFQKNAIFYAGKHFTKNAEAIEKKGVISVGITILVVLQMAAFAWWILR